MKIIITVLILVVVSTLGFYAIRSWVYVEQLKAMTEVIIETDFSCWIGKEIGLKCEKIYE